MLAALLNWGQGTNASHLDLEKERIEVIREVDSGLETLSLALPAVITTDLRLNKPRYIKLPNIMKAKRKPLAVLTPEALAVDISPRLHTLKVELPPQRKAGVTVSSVEELINKLKTEAQVI
jgi:electron transfer flavoprotein beta subunit